MSCNKYLSHYACPNDRVLAILSKLHKGWSIKAQNSKNPHLRTDETIQIIEVVQKAEIFDTIERQRIENLIQRAQNLPIPIYNRTICSICHKSFQWFLGLIHIRYKRQCPICLTFICQNCISRDKLSCKVCHELHEIWTKTGYWFIEPFNHFRFRIYGINSNPF